MISVVTLTYKRKNLLEEAIYSYLLQNFEEESEMVIVNDCENITYNFSHPNIRFINCNKRFSSVGKKLEYGMKNCKYDYVYMLDDDDLLAPQGLSVARQHIKENPNFDIYKCAYHYFFLNNKFTHITGNVNTGNCYTKEYINKIEFPDHGQGYDLEITFNRGGKVYTGDLKRYSMIYRWGMNTTHISGLPKTTNEEIYKFVDSKLDNDLNSEIIPKFNNDYYQQLPSSII